MILLIDNYDSFTYNLYQYLADQEDVKVIRNDAWTIEQIKEASPSLIVLSPGPGHPDEAGMCVEIIQKLGSTIPILGICLGHQAIGVAYGAVVGRAKHVMHGKISSISHNGNDIFEQIEEPVEVMRYHSLVIDPSTVPDELEVIATSVDDNEIMAVKHRFLPIIGMQFHPESIGTEVGKQLLVNCVKQLSTKVGKLTS
ncbi:anthranilate synthase component II [Jeotgalibacillus soli]|uniref:Glutamine amidotransferase domain-containing protein n=1 Tax=Jeotgalibacillus soli TaxID=889306 RepID=A0A0C2V981_9BACL|nr:aminodeoxychorismate/anthranilate synthase component II [Jeotgalibacillus soli]KIL45497.1 hypothetical protein KP78_30410 [Jeotgalibacillus soli]